MAIIILKHSSSNNICGESNINSHYNKYAGITVNELMTQNEYIINLISGIRKLIVPDSVNFRNITTIIMVIIYYHTTCIPVVAGVSLAADRHTPTALFAQSICSNTVR